MHHCCCSPTVHCTWHYPSSRLQQHAIQNIPATCRSARGCRRHTCLHARPLLLCCHLQCDWRDTASPFVAAMRNMTKEALLTYLDEEGVPAAQDLLREQEESRQLQAASRAALKDAAVFGRTNKGRQTFQTILTAHAYDVPEGPSTVPDYRRAQILDVHPAVFNAARQRAKSLQPDLHPATALDVGAYWHRPRARRTCERPACTCSPTAARNSTRAGATSAS